MTDAPTQPGHRPTVLVLAPIAPAATGNGLAMRAGAFVAALATTATVDVAVVPVAGLGDTTWAEGQARDVLVVDPVGDEAARSHVVAQMADGRLRDRLSSSQPLPAGVRSAPPTLADDIIERLAEPPDIVLGLRLSLLPLAGEIARRSDATRLVIDADDDDESLLRQLGSDDEAAAHHRLAAAWLGDADAVLTAAPDDGERLATRHDLDRVVTVPNSVAVPDEIGDAPGQDRILFLGNLTYRPNVHAARELADQILPLVREPVPDATLRLVGAHDPSLTDLAKRPGVHLAGPVATVASSYAQSDVVVIPLRAGSGSRIKVLEAFAHRRPVVATRAAVDGIDAEPGRHYLAADSSEGLATRTVEVLTGASATADLVDEAAHLVRSRYAASVVDGLARAAVLSHDWRPGDRQETPP